MAIDNNIDVCANTGKVSNPNMHRISEYFRKIVRVTEPFEFLARTHKLNLDFYIDGDNVPNLLFQNDEIVVIVNMTNGIISSTFKRVLGNNEKEKSSKQDSEQVMGIETQSQQNNTKYKDAIEEINFIAKNTCNVDRYPFIVVVAE